MDEDSGERGDGGDPLVLEWVDGLPSGDDLIPLSQALVSPELAYAFSIPPQDLKTPSKEAAAAAEAAEAAEAEAEAEENSSSRMPKRARLVWTPQLHKRFVDVVAHLGIKNAVPKTIMQLMNVDGLTRENVASHLQKYRLYLKRMQGGLSSEAPSSTSDHLFASTPVPQSLRDQQHHIGRMHYAVPTIVPMHVFSVPHHHAHGVVPVTNHPGCQLLYQRPYAPNDCSAGTKFASILSNPPHHVSPSPDDSNTTREKRKK